MATSFASDESLLDQNVSEISTTNFVTLWEENHVSTACMQVLVEGNGVVTNEGGFPLGILSGDLAFEWIGKQGVLSEHISQLVPIALSPVQTRMRTILSTVLEVGFIPWFVLTSEKTCVGIVPSISIAHVVSRYLQLRSDASGSFLETFRRTRLGLIDPAPISNPDPPNCYCCPMLFDNKQPHRLVRNQLTKVDHRGNFMCPNHPSTRVVTSVGCTAC